MSKGTFVQAKPYSSIGREVSQLEAPFSLASLSHHAERVESGSKCRCIISILDLSDRLRESFNQWQSLNQGKCGHIIHRHCQGITPSWEGRISPSVKRLDGFLKVLMRMVEMAGQSKQMLCRALFRLSELKTLLTLTRNTASVPFCWKHEWLLLPLLPDQHKAGLIL